MEELVIMLKLSALHNLLKQVLSQPYLHTSVLLTLEGRLVSTAHDPARSKDEIKVVVGLCAEAWKDAKGQEESVMLDSDVNSFFSFWMISSPLKMNPSSMAASSSYRSRKPMKSSH
jgi:hypothetical protein